MDNYIGSIDTDMAIGSILSNFETPYIMNTIHQSLNMKFRPFSEQMPNFVDILQRHLDAVAHAAPDYIEKVESVRQETYKEIIQTICQYYNLSFNASFEDIQPLELYGIAHTMYDVFVSRFTFYMIDFYIRYIINNSDSIYAYLNDPNNANIRKFKEKEYSQRNYYIDPKYVLIHQNLNTVVLNMQSYDISLETLFSYFFDTAQYNRMISLLSDNGDIYKNYYASYLADNRYMADILTVIKLELQSKTQDISNFNIMSTESEEKKEETNSGE